MESDHSNKMLHADSDSDSAESFEIIDDDPDNICNDVFKVPTIEPLSASSSIEAVDNSDHDEQILSCASSFEHINVEDTMPSATVNKNEEERQTSLVLAKEAAIKLLDRVGTTTHPLMYSSVEEKTNASLIESCSSIPPLEDIPSNNILNNTELNVNAKSFILPESVMESSDVEISESIEENCVFKKYKSNINETECDTTIKRPKTLLLSRRIFSNTLLRNHFLQSCEISNDGMCLLFVINKYGMHLANIDNDLLQVASEDNSYPEMSSMRRGNIIVPVISVPETGYVYDTMFNPQLDSSKPETCFWLSSRQHEPIQLWDAYTGGMRSTYRCYNLVDEIEPATRMAMNYSNLMVGACQKYLHFFNLSRPGRETYKRKTEHATSSLDFSNQNDFLATGSWNREINCYDLRTGVKSSIKWKPSITFPKIHNSALSRIKFGFSYMMVSAGRRDGQINVWDLRNVQHPLFKLNREVETNQVIHFDLSKCDRMLVSGGSDGAVKTWDLQSQPNENGQLRCHKIQLHQDSCSGVSLHPYAPILATSTGQHHENNDPLSNVENSINLWWMGNLTNEDNVYGKVYTGSC